MTRDLAGVGREWGTRARGIGEWRRSEVTKKKENKY